MKNQGDVGIENCRADSGRPTCAPMTFFVLVAATILCLPRASFAQSQKPSSKESKDPDATFTKYRQALQRDPNDFEAHNNLGAALSAKGDVDGAIREYREALRLAPNDAEAHNNLGVALGKKGDMEGATAEYQTAVKLKPSFAEAWYDLGVALMGQKNMQEAGKAFRKAINLKPDWVEPHYALAEIFQARENKVFALAEYLEVLRLRPADGAASIGAGTILIGDSCLKEAAEQLQRAVISEPNQAGVHALLGSALYGARDLRGSAEQYAIASRLDANNNNYKVSHKKVSKKLKKHGKFSPRSQKLESPACKNSTNLASLLPYVEGRSAQLPGSAQPVYRVGGDVTEPIPIHTPNPQYPTQARSARFQGTVVLAIVIDTKGNVRDVRILQSLGMGLDGEAIRAVQTWRFKPATRNGIPVPVRVTVEIRFKLFPH